MHKRNAWKIGVIALMVLILGAAAAFHWVHAPTARRVVLPDGTELLFRSDSVIEAAKGFPHPRTIHVDGQFLLHVTPGSEPLTVVSRLLKLTVSGDSTLRLTARSRETGEEVEVLFGDVIARKNYPSSYMEPDHLAAGEMSMVNQTIDLMEKEKFEPAEVRVWADALRSGLTTR